MLAELENELKQAAGQVIDSEVITDSDLKNHKVLTERLSRKVSDELRKTGGKTC